MENNENNVQQNPDYTTVILESGLEVQVKNKKKGRDFKLAQRACKDQSDLQFALTANLIKINGQTPVLEDILDMDLDDVLELIGIVLGKKNSPIPTT